MAPSFSKDDEIVAELQTLRDAPVIVPSEGVLTLITNFLIGPPSNNPHVPQRFEHWFCRNANKLTVEAATFLIRLHAYNSPRVDLWRKQLMKCLSGCCLCVREYGAAKLTSRHTYFGAFKDDVLQGFYENLDKWECHRLLDALRQSGFSSEIESESRHTLSQAPPPVVYHLLSNLQIMRDERILKLLHTACPTECFRSWPDDYPPPGLFYALLADDACLREWALQQVQRCTTTPMLKESFSTPYLSALEDVARTISGQTVQYKGHHVPMAFSQDTSILWTSFALILRLIPVEYLRPGHSSSPDVRHLVLGHLHDTGDHFVDVLRSFVLILTRIGPDVWEGESCEYPQVVLDSIKDNMTYLEALRRLGDEGGEPWLLNWIETYLKTVGNKPIFKDILPIIIQFLCEELQHERFGRLRPTAITLSAKILIAVLSQFEKKSAVIQQELFWKIMDVHIGIFVSVAFARPYAEERWAGARTIVRRLIRYALVQDVKNISSAISILSGANTTTSEVVPLTVREQMWRHIYESILPGDSDGIALLVATLAAIAHVDDLKEVAFADTIAKSAQNDARRNLLKDVNRALIAIRTGFEDAVTRYLDLSPPSVVIGLLGKADVVKNTTILMLSPVETIQETAQALAGFAFDVEVRIDCFRALLERFPAATISGILHSLDTYVYYAHIVPEACSFSKALARCLTDVIDVLCSSPDGSLLNEAYLKGNIGAVISPELSKWWTSMTKALSVIFLKTPKWAVFFDSADMVLWMRDALIFGRDMLAQRRVIESAIAAGSPQSANETKRTLSRAGRRMVDDLQQVLYELTRWLRLTDEELLHQSFALLESLLACFRETQIRPKTETLQKIQKHIDDARKSDPKRPQTRLDSSRLAQLQDSISGFDDEVEVQIIPPQKVSMNQSKISIKNKAGARETASMARRISSAEQFKPKDLQRGRPHAKATIASYFSTDDKKKLDAGAPFPQFTRQAQPREPVARPKTPHGEIKHEGTSAGPTTPVPSSESEREGSDEEEGNAGLALLSKLQRTPTIKKPAERRQVMMLDIPTNARTSAQDRMNRREDARRTQLRLKPDISGLHRTILSWNYDHQGPNPPGLPVNLTPVPDKFSDYQHFRRVFEPMLLLECWSQLAESKEEAAETRDCRIVSRRFVDDWLDLDVSISEGANKDWSLSEVDVVLLRQPGSKKSVLGRAQVYRARPFGIHATIRCLAGCADPGLQVSTTWLLSKVLSLATLHREYAALMALPYFDFQEMVLKARLSKTTLADEEEIRKTMFTYSVNEPQAKAILYALKAEGFALIQGPPGTGKTSTICGLVHAFLSRRPKPVTVIHAGRSTGPADREPVKKVLLCAPSNAAIDEIASRLKKGVSGAGRQATIPNVVRVGAVNSMNINVRDISLEYLIEQKLKANPELDRSRDAGGEVTRLRGELESVKHQRQQKFEEISTIRDNTVKTLSLEEDIRKLNKQKALLTHRIDKLKDKQKSDSRTLDATKRRFRTEVLLEADVICSTLSGAGYEYLEQLEFELIVIDEAAQAIELSSLIPLKYRSPRCVMVGDPQQLPPTVKSQEACNLGYNQSLFVRLQRQRPDAVHLLSIQYRMHPDISQVPSRLFYDGRLRDGPDMAVKTRRPWHTHEKFGTYRFFNVTAGREETGNIHSYVNRAECQVAVSLYRRLRREFSDFDSDFKVGVISMYRGQIMQLRRTFEQQFGAEISRTIDFNTVDGFQGQEKDIIILSCVRAGPGVQSVGFLRDFRRMNVALTRAKSSLFVLGHAPTLERSNDIWRGIVQDAKTRGCLVDVDVAYFTSPAAVTKPAPSIKTSKKSPTKESPLPPQLTTPREFKSLANDAQSCAPNAVEPSTRSTFTTTMKAGKSKLKDSSAGHKRPAPSDVSEKFERPVSDEGDPARLKIPPKKRPKPGPSLFIPKNKRPPQ
ncbi:uncharacterized protein LAESUDRAFT_691154 [Laetiporus sulphureus 93-53]|uniref:Helicase ATP-binding domain-containing protein n=1 Tax=Laetiporus sulphureus 93-53 TaxID=1314785 RepID=A0A165HPW6_9APHY|nr:uncharacterized protein LAESUDRAFT_691154 [Laetiporus sulphureus 93-53]KZT12026.1 hypothetical protein LAESUDRAFT_691154 [Laetiporus sulphureus 93-53]